jgi:DNA-binding transcriptional LysR family regulator
MRNLTLKQLRAVEAVVRNGTVLRAAASLHLTPAALTARLKQIEAGLGVALFDRTNHRLRPTAGGREILSAVEQIDAILKVCQERVDDLRGIKRGSITIGAISTSEYFAPRLVAEFRRTHPGIEIRLLIGNRQDTIRVLREYHADLAIMGRPSAEFAVRHARFGEHPLVLVAAPDHPLLEPGSLRLRDIRGESFLVREPGSGTRQVFDSMWKKSGGTPPAIGMEIPSNETIKQAVMAGLGIALISAHTIEAELSDGRLRLLPVGGFPIRRDWFVVRRADRTAGPVVASFWDFMLSRGRHLLPAVPLP